MLCLHLEQQSYLQRVCDLLSGRLLGDLRGDALKMELEKGVSSAAEAFLILGHYDVVFLTSWPR